jgi:Periplasmic component of the Tol biopolymer transport system
MKVFKIALILVTLLLASTAITYAWSDWLTLKTDHFTVFYKPADRDRASQVLQTLEFYRPQIEKLCGNEQLHVSIVIDDAGIYFNGLTDPINSRIHLFTAHPGGWAGTQDWWSLVGVHEYTHELSLTNNSGFWHALNEIFGPGSGLFYPNLFTPGWIIEGITPYSESQITPYQGRLNDGLFDFYMAARVKDDRFPSILNATFSPLEYSAEGIYTYGGEFLNYLAKTYGEDKLTRFFTVNGRQPGALLFIPAIGIDRSARQVFGKGFRELWMDWRQSEFKQNKDFQYEGEPLTHQGWNISNLTMNGGKLYYQRSYPVSTDAFSYYVPYEIVERDLQTGLEKTIMTTTTDFTSAFQVKNGKLYYATREEKAGYANSIELSYGLYALLHQYDLATHKDRTLLADEIRGFDVLADGKILYSRQLKNGYGSELYQYDPARREKKLLLSSEYLINEIVSDGKRIIVNAQRDWESGNIYRLDLEKKELEPLVQTPFTERRLSLSGDRLFFTANFLKVNSVYCYDFGSGKISRVTRNGWVDCPAYDETTNELYFTQLNSFGYDLYQKTAEFEDYQLPDAPPVVPPTFSLDNSKITSGTYIDNLKTMAPKFWLPMLDSDKHEYGLMIMGADAVEDFPNYSATIVYNTEKDRPMGEFNLPINFFAPLQITLNYSDFDENLTQMMLAYPFINRLSPGLSELLAGTYLTRDEDYKGLEIKPFVTIGLRYPATNATLTVSAPQSTLKNDQERTGLYTDFELKQDLADNEIRLSALMIDDPDNPHTDVFSQIRGYDDALTDNRGKIFIVEYSRPILKIRKGLWNPSVYLGDISGCIFNDQAIPENGPKQDSWGLEAHLETKYAYNNLSLEWGLRFVQTIDGDSRYEIFVKSVL